MSIKLYGSPQSEKSFMQNMIKEEAKEFDEFAVGVYQAVDMERLVGHTPIKLSSLMYNFLALNDNSSLQVIVT